MIKNGSEDLKMLLLNFTFVIIYVIHKMLVLLKNHLNYLKHNIFESFFKRDNKLLFSIQINSKPCKQLKALYSLESSAT